MFTTKNYKFSRSKEGMLFTPQGRRSLADYYLRNLKKEFNFFSKCKTKLFFFSDFETATKLEELNFSSSW